MIDHETRAICSDLYVDLRADTTLKRIVQPIETKLSEEIVRAELCIQDAKFSGAIDQEASARRRRAILKRLADGLAWKCLPLNDLDLGTLPEPQAPGFMAGKAGYASERRALIAALTRDYIRFAIQNDSTNILRVGDVTLLHEDGRMVPIEIKQSRRQMSRAKRQVERNAEILAYLRHGMDMNISVCNETRRAAVLSEPRHYYWPALDNLIPAAAAEGSAHVETDDGVLLVAHRADCSDLELLERLMVTRWDRPNVQFGCLARQLDPLDYDPIRFVVPLTAFEVTVSAGLPLITGDIDVVIVVNMDFVKSQFDREGYEFRIEQSGNLTVLPSQGARFEKITIFRPWLFVIYGLQTVSSFVRQVVEFARQTDRLMLS